MVQYVVATAHSFDRTSSFHMCCCTVTVAKMLYWWMRSSTCPFDQSLWRSIQEDQFGVKLFFQFQFTCFPHLKKNKPSQSRDKPNMRRQSLCATALYQKDVCAQFEDAVNAGKLLKHDGVADPAEELPHKLPNHQNHGGVQSHDAAAWPWRREKGTEQQKMKNYHCCSSNFALHFTPAQSFMASQNIQTRSMPTRIQPESPDLED